MTKLNERDWELVNAYHDGELGDAERHAFEARLSSEAALNDALKDVASVSASLGALRPEPPVADVPKPGVPANQNRRPARWFVGGAIAVAIAATVAWGPQYFDEPSVFDTHAEFAAQEFAVEDGALRTVFAGDDRNAPDLIGANLTAVATRQIAEGHVTHYAGRNGCRLSYFRGTFGLNDQVPGGNNQVATWTTADNVGHMIVATGMDQIKFDAISQYLERITKQQAADEMLATLVETVSNAKDCVS